METCFLMIGEASSPMLADRVAEQYKACPFVYFLAAFGRMLVGVWYLPENHRWWLEMVAEEPEATLGLVRVAIYETDSAAYPRTAEPRGAGAGLTIAPCGSDCQACDRFSACERCPATMHRQMPE